MPGLSNLTISSLALCQSPTPPDEGGGGELPEAPEGFAYLVNSDDKYVVNNDDAFILAKV